MTRVRLTAVLGLALAGCAAGNSARAGLTRAEAEAAGARLWQQRVEELRAERHAEFEARALEADGVRLPFWFTRFGEAPPGERSLWISLHGGGGAPAEVNDQQWQNQQRLYTPAEGFYVAPRAPTDTWNLWHQAHIDVLLVRLITDFIALQGVNPDRVYLLGYSAGGDGVYQLAPRMADRFAAAAMMAGHPNETQPDGLRNLPFAIHVGALDDGYGRNAVAASWAARLDEFSREHPADYLHAARLHEGKGHWMDRQDAEALRWMAQFSRRARPRRITWLQDDVTHSRFYWLAVDEPAAGARVEAEIVGQTVRILAARGVTSLRIRLDDELLDLDREVVVVQQQRELFRGRVPRSLEVLARTLAERNDPRGIYSAEVVVTL
ncbi:MAG: alpha/beta hydrolase [Planctomycetota bacterium]